MRETKRISYRIGIVASLVVIMIVGGMAMLGCVRMNVMDGGDMRNPDYVAALEEVDAALEDVDYISYDWHHGSMPQYRSYLLRKEGDVVLFTYSIQDYDDDGVYREVEVVNKEVDPAVFDEAVSLLREDEVHFIKAVMDENNSDGEDEYLVLDADSSSLTFRGAGNYYSTDVSSCKTIDFLEGLVEEDQAG